jgi:hypothetical protein
VEERICGADRDENDVALDARRVGKASEEFIRRSVATEDYKDFVRLLAPLLDAVFGQNRLDDMLGVGVTRVVYLDMFGSYGGQKWFDDARRQLGSAACASLAVDDYVYMRTRRNEQLL